VKDSLKTTDFNETAKFYGHCGSMKTQDLVLVLSRLATPQQLGDHAWSSPSYSAFIRTGRIPSIAKSLEDDSQALVSIHLSHL
jgi:hypothetical protein